MSVADIRKPGFAAVDAAVAAVAAAGAAAVAAVAAAGAAAVAAVAAAGAPLPNTPPRELINDPAALIPVFAVRTAAAPPATIANPDAAPVARVSPFSNGLVSYRKS